MFFRRIPYLLALGTLLAGQFLSQDKYDPKKMTVSVSQLQEEYQRPCRADNVTVLDATGMRYYNNNKIDALALGEYYGKAFKRKPQHICFRWSYLTFQTPPTPKELIVDLLTAPIELGSKGRALGFICTEDPKLQEKVIRKRGRVAVIGMPCKN